MCVNARVPFISPQRRLSSLVKSLRDQELQLRCEEPGEEEEEEQEEEAGEADGLSFF